MKKENKALAKQRKAQEKKRQILKKKILIIGSIVLAAAVVIGVALAIRLSNDAANAPETLKFSKYLTKDGKVKGIDIDDYVNLCDLEEVLKLKAEDVEPDEETVLALMEGYLSGYQELITEEGIVLEDGDTIQLQYVGTVDGVAFEGGSTGEEGTTLTLGSGTYIDGFEDQLIGRQVGEAVDVRVTFPEDYGNEELNGKDAVFAVIIDGVYRLEITDALVAEHVEGCSTVEEFRAMAYETIYSDSVNTLAWQAISVNSEIINFPQKYAENLIDMITYYYQQEFLSVNESYYQYYGQYIWTSMEEFFEQYYGMTADDVMTAIEYNASVDITFALICQAISEERGVTYTEEDKLNFISNLGYAEDEMEEAVAAYGEGYICQGAISLAVDRYIESLVVVSE